MPPLSGEEYILSLVSGTVWQQHEAGWQPVWYIEAGSVLNSQNIQTAWVRMGQDEQNTMHKNSGPQWLTAWGIIGPGCAVWMSGKIPKESNTEGGIPGGLPTRVRNAACRPWYRRSPWKKHYLPLQGLGECLHLQSQCASHFSLTLLLGCLELLCLPF